MIILAMIKVVRISDYSRVFLIYLLLHTPVVLDAGLAPTQAREVSLVNHGVIGANCLLGVVSIPCAVSELLESIVFDSLHVNDLI